MPGNIFFFCVGIILFPRSLLHAVHDMEEHLRDGDPIWVRTRSSHWRGPFR